MITNLFSIFDPSSTIFSISWWLTFISFLIIPTNIWNTSPSVINTINKLTSIFNNEISFTLGNNQNGIELLILTVFITILSINFLALYPQIFSLTSHLSINLPIALTLWLSLIIFGWINNTSHMLTHLLPQGTPAILISFIVIIEITSNIIRPLTLCVRLTANLIAGHLLMSLLGNAILNITLLTGIFTLPIPMILTILESAVAIIQAYVFITLITLYTTEVN